MKRATPSGLPESLTCLATNPSALQAVTCAISRSSASAIEYSELLCDQSNGVHAIECQASQELITTLEDLADLAGRHSLLAEVDLEQSLGGDDVLEECAVFVVVGAGELVSLVDLEKPASRIENVGVRPLPPRAYARSCKRLRAVRRRDRRGEPGGPFPPASSDRTKSSRRPRPPPDLHRRHSTRRRSDARRTKDSRSCGRPRASSSPPRLALRAPR